MNLYLHAALEIEPGSFEAEMVDMFINLLSDPESLSAFFANECKTEAVTGEIATFYATMQSLEPAVGPVTACRDVSGVAEQYFSCASICQLPSIDSS